MSTSVFSVLAIAAVLSVASALVSLEGPEEQFEQFKLKYNKKYSGAEHEQRFVAFKANLAWILELQQEQVQASADPEVFGITKFVDMTREEFQNTLFPRQNVGDQGQDYPKASVRSPPSGFVPPSSLDWRTKGVVGAVRDQGQCGNCWAHSVVEEIESMYAMGNKTLVPLSVQEVTSCDIKQKWPCDHPSECKNVDDGCDGGDPPFGILFACKTEKGLATEEAYPSKSPVSGNTLKCKKEIPNQPLNCSGFSWATPPCNYKEKCQNQNMTLFRANMAAYGPTSISVDATNGWQVYNKGLFPASKCKQSFGSLDHSIQAVGYGEDDGKLYYLVRNSWGKSWGEDGYIRLEADKDDDPCGIADEALFVDF